MDDTERAALAREFADYLDMVSEVTKDITPEYVEARLQEILRGRKPGGDADGTARRLGPQAERN
jgi:hypothetical protein